MIHLYCYSCGLYICVPSDFEGGKGTCPRCKVSLRIPKPRKPSHNPYDPNFRYLAEMVNVKPKPADKSVVITPNFGPSHIYKCQKCGNAFESILGKSCPQNRCPNCGDQGVAVKKHVKFPRPGESNQATCKRKTLDPAGASTVIPQQIPASSPAPRPIPTAEPQPVPVANNTAPAPTISPVTPPPGEPVPIPVPAPAPARAPQPVSAATPAVAPASSPAQLQKTSDGFTVLYPCEDQTITPDILNAKAIN